MVKGDHSTVLCSQVSEDHCWLTLDGTGARETAAEVAAERPQAQGEPPALSAWSTWLYTCGHATVCTRAQTAAAVVASMDTCVGEKGSEDCDAACKLQQQLFARLPPHALYCNARCLALELDQDAALERAKEATHIGANAAMEALRKLRKPFDALLTCAFEVPTSNSQGASSNRHCSSGEGAHTSLQLHMQRWTCYDCQMDVRVCQCLLATEATCCLPK